MAKYKVRYYECYEEFYEVEADSKEKAEEMVKDDIYNSRAEGPNTCYDSGCETELIESEGDLSMSRVENIKKFVERKEKRKKDKQALALLKIEEYKKKIIALKPRIDELLAVGNACKENGIPLAGSSWGGHEGYDTHQFISNGWSHVTGFILEGKKDMPFTKVGKTGGGACGWNLQTDGETIAVSGDVEFVMKKFLEQFDEFETEFYKYVDEVTTRTEM